MIYEKDINMSAVDAVQRFKECAKENGLTVVGEKNLKDTFKENGYFYPFNTYVLEVCHSEMAVNILNTTEQAVYFLPCKISIFETDEAVKIGFRKPSKLIATLEHGDESKHYAAEVEDTLMQIIDRMVTE
ncbi:MAG: DUF302 domain-containing protein [Clostridia bacterium]|nr:DUF302 domain-containing protein [Clostridia bacterium]